MVVLVAVVVWGKKERTVLHKSFINIIIPLCRYVNILEWKMKNIQLELNFKIFIFFGISIKPTSIYIYYDIIFIYNFCCVFLHFILYFA